MTLTANDRIKFHVEELKMVRGEIATDIEQFYKNEVQCFQWTGGLLAGAVGIGSTRLSGPAIGAGASLTHEIIAFLFLAPYLLLISTLIRLVGLEESIYNRASYILDYVERPLRIALRGVKVAEADESEYMGWENYLCRVVRGTECRTIDENQQVVINPQLGGSRPENTRLFHYATRLQFGAIALLCSVLAGLWPLLASAFANGGLPSAGVGAPSPLGVVWFRSVAAILLFGYTSYWLWKFHESESKIDLLAPRLKPIF